MSRSRLFALVGLAAVLSLGAFAPASFGQAASLSGESLESNPVFGGGQETSTQFTCNKDGTTDVSFQTSGLAFGPYTGTFTESGSFTIGPQDNTSINSLGVGAITAFEATFTINSEFPPGTVTGTKQLASPLPVGPSLADGFGRCDPDGSSPPVAGIFAILTDPNVVYQAQIDAATGSRTDSGTGSVLIQKPPVAPQTHTFQEIFNSTEPVPEVCEDDDDAQGDDDQGDDDDQGCDEDDQGEDEDGLGP